MRNEDINLIEKGFLPCTCRLFSFQETKGAIHLDREFSARTVSRLLVEAR